MTNMNSVRPSHPEGWVRAKGAKEKEVMGIKRRPTQPWSGQESGEPGSSTDAGRGIGQVPRTWTVPKQPTPQEIEEHNIAHLPYQPWCKYCVQGKAPNHKHQKVNRNPEEGDGVPHVVMD